MANDFTVQIKGLAELQRVLDEMPNKLERRAYRRMLKAAAAPMFRAAQQNLASVAKPHTFDLWRSLRIRMMSYQAKSSGLNQQAQIVVGNKKAFYAYWIEYGTAAHRISAKARRVGDLKSGALLIPGVGYRDQVVVSGIQPRAFMRPAFDGSTNEALDIMAQEVRAFLDEGAVNE